MSFGLGHNVLNIGLPGTVQPGSHVGPSDTALGLDDSCVQLTASSGSRSGSYSEHRSSGTTLMVRHIAMLRAGVGAGVGVGVDFGVEVAATMGSVSLLRSIVQLG